MNPIRLYQVEADKAMLPPTLDDVRRALALPDFDVTAAWLRMAPLPRARPLERFPSPPEPARLAGVLLLLYPVEDRLTFALTRRTETVATHKGQISLPGGAQEGDETPTQTALRETCEEIGVCDVEIGVVGALTPLYVIVSDFVVHPLVGYLPQRPDFRPDPVEVEQVIEMSLIELLNDSTKVVEQWVLHGETRDVPFYRVGGYPVWGATAIMLSELEGRLRTALEISSV